MQKQNVTVSARTLKNYSPIPDYEWPVFTTDAERIKQNTLRYRNIDCATAFSKHYNIKIDSAIEPDEIYSDVAVGDLIDLRLLDVTKKDAIFDTGSFKENVVSAVNLFQYNKFKTGKWKKGVKVKCKVIGKEHNKVIVDPIAPMFDKWIKEKLDSIPFQYNIKEDKSIKVSNLHLINNAGFMGDVRVDSVSDFCGQDVCVKAFIPGSQIVLNIERDFEKWEGQTVNAFITNYINKKDAKGEKMSLICSAKEYLKFQGDKNKLDIFNMYCLQEQEWEDFSKKKLDGVVTGIINSSKKQGVFIEISDLNITGMIEMKSEELNHYHPGQSIQVILSRIDEPVFYNENVDQMQHSAPYIVEDDILKKCNLRFVFEMV